MGCFKSWQQNIWTACLRAKLLDGVKEKAVTKRWESVVAVTGEVTELCIYILIQR